MPEIADFHCGFCDLGLTILRTLDNSKSVS